MGKSTEPTYKMVTIDGRTVRMARWEAKGRTRAERPLLFFNGIGANIELIAPFAAMLSSRDVVTFDMPGIGDSPEPLVPYWPWMMARIADEIMNDFGYDKIDVMGVSWGGAMAQQYALQYGSRVERLILAATSAGMLMVPGKLSALTKMADPRRYIDPDFMMKNFRTLYGGSTDGSDGHTARIKPPSKTGYFYQLFAMLGWTSAPFLPFMGPKTMIMMGDEDNIVPLANGRILNTLIPRSRLEVIKGGGHLFLVSMADQTIPLIEDFLDGDAAEARKAA
jgi:poly(3-hydroxyalkanoate) depolymerase